MTKVSPGVTRPYDEPHESWDSPPRTRREAILLMLMSMLAPWTTACSAGAGGRWSSSRHLSIATGGTEGVYYRYGAGLGLRIHGALPGVTVENRATSGSVENLQLLASNKVTLAFSAADAATDAYAGRAPFTAPVPVRAVAMLYEDYLHLIVPAGSRVRTITDLRGSRVSLGPVGSGTALIANRLLAAARVGPTQITNVALGINESVTALEQGRIAAFFWSGGLPTQGILELARRIPIRLIPMRDEAEAMRSTYGATYRLATVPENTYGSNGSVATLAVPDMLVTSASCRTRLISEVTRLLFASREMLARTVPEAARLDVRTAIFTEPLPLHAGALRFYRAAKP